MAYLLDLRLQVGDILPRHLEVIERVVGVRVGHLLEPRVGVPVGVGASLSRLRCCFSSANICLWRCSTSLAFADASSIAERDASTWDCSILRCAATSPNSSPLAW